MKSPASSDRNVACGTQLLGAIESRVQEVGEGLNEDELTRLLQRTELPVEAGFAFLSFSEGNVVFAVPRQALSAWYPAHGWIRPEKEKIGRDLAIKYGLTLVEPPDRVPDVRFPLSEIAGVHHHLEFARRHETVIVAHPQYLKVRLFGSAFDRCWLRDVKIRIYLGPDLLQDLSALYSP